MIFSHNQNTYSENWNEEMEHQYHKNERNNKNLQYCTSLPFNFAPNKKSSKLQKENENKINQVALIPRHSSEEELKKFNENGVYFIQEKNHTLESNIFIDQNKAQFSPEFNSEEKTSIKSSDSSNEKIFFDSFNKISINFGNALKETSSTVGTTMKATPKQTPKFLNNKSKNIFNKTSLNHKFEKNDFQVLKKLGEGKFGKVFLVREIRSSFILAMKVVEKKQIVSEGLLEQFIKELKIQSFLKHPNIIEVYGFFQDNENFYTLMELGCDGQLYDIISENKKITEETTSFITRNLLQAVSYMHENRILHRDIKTENIVRIMGNVKICDFGWATNKMTKEELRSTLCGTPLYLSPEVLNGEKYDEKVDLWSIGILTFELLMGKSPFDIHTEKDLFKIISDKINFNVGHPKIISKEFEEFMECILNKNAKQRFNSEELLQCKFIQKYMEFETCEELCN